MPPSASNLGSTQMYRLSLAPNQQLAFWVGLCASFAVGIIIDGAKNVGLDAGIATSIVMTITTSILWIVFPEKIKLGSLSLVLVLIGLVLGSVYGYFHVGGEDVRIVTTNPFDIEIYMLNMVVVIPLFEELCVRRLMFLGASHKIGPYLSAIMVSWLFAWTHNGMFAFAFSMSLILCAATYGGVDTVNRAIFHGSYNLLLTAHLLHNVI